MKRITLCIVFLASGIACVANTMPDSLKVPEVLIVTDRNANNSPGYKTVVADSLTMSDHITGTLGDILGAETTIYIKRYSVTGLSTPSFRGMGDEQTQILWNGMPINSSTLGDIDLTTLPAGLFSNVEVLYGNSSLLNGLGGGIGGSIELLSLPDWDQLLSASAVQEAGSFGTYHTVLHFSIGNRKWQSRSGFIFNKAKNDFPFINNTLFGNPVQTMQDATFEQYGAMQEVYGRLKHGHQLAFRTLFTLSNREIPPAIISSNDTATQHDVLFLLNAEWKYNTGIHSFRDDVSYKFDNIHYVQLVGNINDNDFTHTIDHNFSYSANPLSQLSFTARMENEYQLALTPDYAGHEKEQAVNNLFTNFSYLPIHSLELILTLREELVDSRLSPFLPALAVNYMLPGNTGLKLYANGYRNYRYPTLNDRYWNPGGNPNLHPEISQGTEGGLSWSKPLAQKRLTLEANVTGYAIWVDNWIQWVPTPGNSEVYTPENVQKVFFRGAELRVKLTAHPGNWLIQFLSNYQYGHATVLESAVPNDPAVGNDPIYTPRQMGNISFRLDYKGWYITYEQLFTGRRFTTADDDTAYALPAYTTCDVTIGKNFHKVVPGLGVYIRFSNINNEQYQNIIYEPMPGRAYTGGLKYTFQKPLKQGTSD